jgi:hypothetical protein
MELRAFDNTRRGLALPSAIFTLVALSVLATGLFTFADLGAKSVRNRESATRAQHVAEAGVNHALGLLRGSLRSRSFSQILRGADGNPGTVDDSLFINWPGLALGDQIPQAGQAYQGHTYVVTIADDPADTDGNASADMNGRVRLWCRAVTADGATAVIEGVVGSVPMPAIAADGNLNLGNSNVISGECGGVHVNGDLTSTAGGPILSGPPTATGTVTGNFNGPPRVNGAPEVPIPDLNPMNYCAGADFTFLLVGGLPHWRNPAGVTTPGLPPGSGWVYTAATHTWEGVGSPTTPPAGTYCVHGNAWLRGSTGSSVAPKNISILASGSIRADGTPYIRPDQDDGILLMAGGDLFLAGNNTTGVDNYQGMLYAGAQCQAQGNAKTFGQLLCANGPQPVGATEYVATNVIAGNFSLNFDCSANVFNKRRMLYWYPRIGT